MRRTVWTFGLIAGAVMSALMAGSMLFIGEIGNRGLIIGYAGMVLAFLMVYFGVRRYRDEVLGGTIGFGRAFHAGLLITLIACACYVATWEVIYYTAMPDFAEKYAARVLEQAKASGASAQELDAKAKEMAQFAKAYRNPLVNVAYTFIEPFPVGLVFTLVCAGLLSRGRKPREVSAGPSSAGAASPA